MSHRFATSAALAVAVLFAAAEADPVQAAAEATRPATPSVKMRYAVTLAGLPIARAELTVTTPKDDHYSTHLTWNTTGLVDVVAATRGDATATGAIGGRHPVPSTYTLASGEGRKAMKVTLAMAGGTVKATEVQPPMGTGPDTVPLEPRHRVDVVDPLSATLLSGRDVKTPEDVCNRTIQIFDGWTRYDLRLSPKTTLPNKRAGVTGPIVVCAARWVPVAGHRSKAKVTRFMADNEDLSVTWGRLEKAAVWVPIDLSIRTMIGTAELKAEKIVAVGDAAPATDAAPAPTAAR